MERLTTDTPIGNFETILNFVHGKDGWAHIYDADGKETNLITWAITHCHDRGCDDFQCKTLEEYDEALSSCMMDFMDCPVAMAYCFASQAVHLRNRLKMYEDAMPLDRVRELAQAEKDGRLWMLAVVPQGRPGGRENRVYVIENGEIYDDYVVGVHIGVSSNGELRCLYETYEGSDFYSADIGKPVFLTRKEAEAELKRREEADNETD